MVFSALVMMGAAGKSIAGDERAALEEQASALQKKILVLKREQDFLLFQKAMYSSDSKYLIMNLERRTGQLKYKNRVLMDFRFRISGKYRGHRIQSGMLALTKKKEGRDDHDTLTFGGRSFIMQWQRTVVPAEEVGIPAISLPKKDMMSIYYALEEGALAYVIH